jgi:hypothetical protein
MHRRPPLGALEVDREALLIAVECREEAGAKPAQPARAVAFRRRLDLDDVGAKLGEDEARRRSHDRVAELQDLDASERCR